MMNKNKTPLPAWCNRTLQGLTYWIGHRRAMYDGQRLTEGALVAEACNLIYVNLKDDEDLLCEVQYSRLMPAPSKTVGGDRADLVIGTHLEHRFGTKKPGDLQGCVSAVIEIKRTPAGRELIDKDIRRLGALKAQNPSVRAFLLLISEANRPSRFVRDDGTAVRGERMDLSPRISGSCYKVRRVCKAAQSFNGTESAHYALVIEVLNTIATT